MARSKQNWFVRFLGETRMRFRLMMSSIRDVRHRLRRRHEMIY